MTGMGLFEVQEGFAQEKASPSISVAGATFDLKETKTTLRSKCVCEANYLKKYYREFTVLERASPGSTTIKLLENSASTISNDYNHGN